MYTIFNNDYLLDMNAIIKHIYKHDFDKITLFAEVIQIAVISYHIISSRF